MMMIIVQNGDDLFKWLSVKHNKLSDTSAL